MRQPQPPKGRDCVTQIGTANPIAIDCSIYLERQKSTPLSGVEPTLLTIRPRLQRIGDSAGLVRPGCQLGQVGLAHALVGKLALAVDHH